MKTLSTAQDTIGDLAGSVGTLASDGADLAADLVDDLTDVAEVAIDTIASTSRVGVRFVGRTVGFVARHPREVLAGIALVAVVAAVLGYLKSSSNDATT